MSVGGRIIEIRPMRIEESGQGVVRLWVVDPRTSDELCVYAEPADKMPAIGESIWWQSGKIMFDNDRSTLNKVGYSFRAPVAA